MHFKHKMQGAAHLYTCCEVAGYACSTPSVGHAPLLQRWHGCSSDCCNAGCSHAVLHTPCCTDGLLHTPCCTDGLLHTPCCTDGASLCAAACGLLVVLFHLARVCRVDRRFPTPIPACTAPIGSTGPTSALGSLSTRSTTGKC
jgi:hypothetical protein